MLEEGGRAHFPGKVGVEDQFKPCLRLVGPAKAKSDEWRPKGAKHFAEHMYDDIKRPEQRHFEESLSRSASATNISDKWTSKMRIPGPKSVEYYMEPYINRKQRVSCIDGQRNGISIASQGDKPYKDPIYEPEFHKKGGLISGSTIQLRKSAKPELRKSEGTFVMNSTTKPKLTMTFAQKQVRAGLEYDLQEVLALNKPIEKLGQVVPSWEERTGYWLCRPEDEAD
jgi:hypothetical protein